MWRDTEGGMRLDVLEKRGEEEVEERRKEKGRGGRGEEKWVG